MHSRNGLKKTLPGQKMSTSQVREGATEEIPSQWDNAAVKGDREQTVHTSSWMALGQPPQGHDQKTTQTHEINSDSDITKSELG